MASWDDVRTKAGGEPGEGMLLLSGEADRSTLMLEERTRGDDDAESTLRLGARVSVLLGRGSGISTAETTRVSGDEG